MSRRYVTQVRVRWSDLDAFRHVNNAKTVTLLEEARVDWLFSEAARHGVDRLTEGIVVARLEIDYKRPIGMELPVTVSMGLTKLGLGVDDGGLHRHRRRHDGGHRVVGAGSRSTR